MTRTARSGVKRIVYKKQTLTDNVLQERRVNPGFWTRTVRDLLATLTEKPVYWTSFLRCVLLRKLFKGTLATGDAALSIQAPVTQVLNPAKLHGIAEMLEKCA